MDTNLHRRNNEELFIFLGLRSQDKLQYGSNAAFHGYLLIVGSSLLGVLFLYAAFISKLLPDTGNYILDAVKYDKYFCFLLPLLLIPTSLMIFVNWLAMKHFEQN